MKTTVLREVRSRREPSSTGRQVCCRLGRARCDGRQGSDPDTAAIKAWAAKHKANENDAVIKFYAWKRFTGFGKKELVGKKAAWKLRNHALTSPPTWRAFFDWRPYNHSLSA
jgi:hypothetical protein